MELVYAEKLRVENTNLSLFKEYKYSFIMTDFPVPVSPDNITLNPPSMSFSRIYLNLTVSFVGTKILKYGWFGLYLNSVMISVQDLNSFLE